MKAQHTPGPWTTERNVDNGAGEITVHCGDIYGAAVLPVNGDNWPEEEQAANARLMAAAPSMYDAPWAIANMQIQDDTNRGEVLALCMSIAKIELERVKGETGK